MNSAPKLTPDDCRREQQQDPEISPVIDPIRQKTHLQYNTKETDPSGMRVLLKYRKDLWFNRGLLYRKVKLKVHDEMVAHFVLPKPFRKRVILACHDDYGHLGMECTLGLLQDGFFWPKMEDDAGVHIRTCPMCVRFKQPQERAEVKCILVTYPLEMVQLDFLVIGSKQDKNVNILVITDSFTKYVQAHITPTQTASIGAITLWEKFMVHYGWPEKLLTDQGKSFESRQKLTTSPYRPETNDQCDHFNVTLVGMLGMVPLHAKCNWQEWVSTLHSHLQLHNLFSDWL